MSRIGQGLAPYCQTKFVFSVRRFFRDRAFLHAKNRTEAFLNDFAIALIVSAAVLASALLGQYLRQILPKDHFTEEATDAVKLAIGLVATMAAIALGLLISSAKDTFDTVNRGIVQNAARIQRLDRVLAGYGSDAQPLRDSLKRNFASDLELFASGNRAQLAKLSDGQALDRMDAFQQTLAILSPDTVAQQHFQAEATRLANEIYAAFWLALLQKEGSISAPLMIVMVSWLIIIFGAFGLLAPRNGMVVTTLVLCALSVSAAIFLMLEFDRPLDGVVRIPTDALREVVSQLGR